MNEKNERNLQPTRAAEREPFELAWSGGGEPPERTIDFGPDGVGGSPVVELAEASGPCVGGRAHDLSEARSRPETSAVVRKGVT